ncbi:hypothetical protein GJU39_10550 [Pedobacter petrophilus]|uniref:Uncharacterized protein n=1 Tax=Pedobacter petrophilus TaxID=1908241 RepID=A0A7K0FYK3_9SPHI|nr:hypothetical protein [Pedobacter petrophilus]MRX76531.1 hypothetical protein [Pedobacter petrophilus]
MKSNLKTFTLIFSFIGLTFLPITMLIQHNRLVTIQGILSEVNKSSNRIPYYRLNLNGYKSTFQNKGNGLLSLLKPAIVYDRKPVFFKILKDDLLFVNTYEKTTYIGFNGKHTLIDLYYCITKPSLFIQIFLVICGFTLVVLNLICHYRYKQKIFARLMFAALLFSFLLMLL